MTAFFTNTPKIFNPAFIRHIPFSLHINVVDFSTGHGKTAPSNNLTFIVGQYGRINVQAFTGQNFRRIGFFYPGFLYCPGVLVQLKAITAFHIIDTGMIHFIIIDSYLMVFDIITSAPDLIFLNRLL
ncbi:hypothetical protein Xmau_03351 [Xenorhabdus mauleonii]|uniref:Uncharacterized protein n=1 Tax=Xenorhabdus mauleonii TaxID=351675 RepID=A0A2G0NV40_9GAMM|nr:hypothetical protein Xmau_03351 [Xenorhabdus mauleonii]